MKLLIIDDDTIDRMNSLRNLKGSGLIFNVVEATTAEDGLRFAESNRFDVILLDYQLPGMDGLEVLKILRASPLNSTAILMLSHSNDEELAIKCVEAGAQDFVTKSEVSSARLKRAILHAKERFKLEQELRSSHENLRLLAEQDSLTGLANRYLFDKTIKSAIPLAKRENKYLALVMLDLDNFKKVNDTMGHDAGDTLLKEVAQRLQKPVRDSDILCRLGGDEFAILMQNIDEPAKVRQLTDRIFAVLQAPVYLNNSPFFVTASIGIATYPDCANDAGQLMKCADIAMYRSKDAGRNQSHFYSTLIHEEVNKRVILEQDLRIALEQNQFILHYQPQVSYRNHELVGVEALIRWQHPIHGTILPMEFIPVAEEIGLMNAIGRWVIENACAQFSLWRTKSRTNSLQLSLATNLSTNQLNDGGFLKILADVIAKYQIPPQQIELEFSADTINQNESASCSLQGMADLGIKLVLAGFGAGQSSLSHLKDHPIDIIKINKSFMQKINNENDTIFLRAISDFAKTLQLEVVAEGVETIFQKELCESFKFDRIQGFYFATPLPATEFESRWLIET